MAAPTPLISDLHADVIIVGAGITGAFVAERLTREGRQVVVVDRRGAQTGSTAASTALVLWETDTPLLMLEQRLGLEAAACVFRRSFEAVRGIGALAAGLKIDCGFAYRDSLYLAGDMLDGVDLKEEARLRGAAGLQSDWNAAEEIYARDGIVAQAALRSPGAAEVDPIALARGLIGAAQARGALVLDGVTALEFEASARGVAVRCDTGAVLTGASAILATGYEMPPFVRGAGHAIGATWVIASAPIGAWPSRALVWEASDAYAYLRTAHGRIIAGGEDEDNLSAEARDALMPAKAKALLAKLAELFPNAAGAVSEFSWSGFFGTTQDSLPLIGPVDGMPNLYAAYGYGGNGITFSAIAADMLSNLIAGRADPDAGMFALDRFD